MTRNSFRKLSFLLIAVVLSGTLYLSTTYATLAPLTPPPSGGYDAGTNSILDPGCGPTDTDCFVKPITADNGLTATGSNVQLGGTLMQDTLIDQGGNDFAIFNGNFSFESGNNNLLAVPGIFSTYQDSTTTAIMGIGEFGGPSEKASFIAHSYNDGAGTTSASQFFLGAIGGATYTSSIGWSSNFTSPTESYTSEMVDLHRQIYFQNRNVNSGLRSTLGIDTDAGIIFTFSDGVHADESYIFPRTDGTVNQVLTTNGAGQLSWRNPSPLQWYSENAAAPVVTPVATGSGSIALGDDAQALAANMFVYGGAAGNGAFNASSSNFLGWGAGIAATSASNSNFLGSEAGKSASQAFQSNFFGFQSGYEATNASRSNFFGRQAGTGAIDAAYSNFIGYQSGSGSVKAANSIFIGTLSGYSDSADNTTNPDDYSILIGNNSGTNGFENSIALGAYATNTASNQFIIGSATRPIDEIVMVSTGGTTCATDINGTACSSDQRLKTNITNLSTTTLDTLLNIKTVTFNWNNNTDTANHIGFIAQDIQQYFPELVSTGSTGYLSVNYAGMTPVIVEAIREMNLKITDINNTSITNTWRDALISWFGNVGNGIQRIFTKTVRVQNGVEMIDHATGELYCTFIENGEFKKVLGECTDSISIPPLPSDLIISPDPDSDPMIDLTSNPDIAPDPIITTPETIDSPTISDPVPPSSEPEPTTPTE